MPKAVRARTPSPPLQMRHRSSVDPGGQRGEGQRERRKAGTHLCGNGGLDLCALLLLALEDGRCVSGDVLETVDDVRMLSRNLEVARGVGVRMGRVSARWGGHGRVGDGVRERRTLGFQVGNSGRGGTERWNAERTRKGVSILYSREDVRGTFGVFCHVRWVQMAQAPARTASHCRSARKISADCRRLVPSVGRPATRDRRRPRRPSPCR